MIMKLKKRPGPNRGCRAMEEEEELPTALHMLQISNSISGDRFVLHFTCSLFLPEQIQIR
jgi:hypothetical protein